MADMSRIDIVTVRAEVKAECLRRDGFGSLAGYANDSIYGITSAPSAGSIITAAQGRAVIDPLVAVKDFGKLRNVVQDDYIPPDFDKGTMITYVNVLKAEDKGGLNTSCRSACTGICVAYCTSTCRNECLTGCGGSCASNCSTACGSGCAGSCANTCVGSCVSTCVGSCSMSSSD